VKVLVTGAGGFVGRNLCAAFRQRQDIQLSEHDAGDDPAALDRALREAEIVFHLAGVNRPANDAGFIDTVDFTAAVCRALEQARRKATIVLTSSIQADQENAYGRSKLGAEAEVRRYAETTGAQGIVYRLKNLFGKWCRPNYNSVTATFCHNIARGLPIQISDPAATVDLTYIDDVVVAFSTELSHAPVPGFRFAEPLPSHLITLGDLAKTIESFRAHREDLRLPDYSSAFVRALYATYLSYLEPERLAYGLDVKSDARGSLAEFVKSPQFGQIFVSRTKPGVTRGNHYHHTKAEKFLVVQGQGIIRLRQIHGDAVIEHHVRGDEYRVIDIPPGYTHSIENVGSDEMVTLFWSSEVFDPKRSDTVSDPVVRAASKDGPAR
jgi:UDP-2-acetamido-2,6-beta-L-arabino-hexul-4-ose reductase